MAKLNDGGGELPNDVANFYSDTQTKPTRAMRETVLEAAVGDEQKGEDPTTAALCVRVAELLGKEDAVFMPSGTMCNEIALYIHCRRGDEIICERSSHIVNFEAGGPAAFAGAATHPLDGEHGRFTAEQVSAAIRHDAGLHLPETALVSVEQTANMGGGAIWPLVQLNAVARVAKDAGIATHMDGARLFNASVKSGVAAKDFAAGYDSVWVDFTKGLGCPLGAVLAGSKDFVQRAKRVKQMIGGGLRQSGFVTAACHYALDHHVERLAEDHDLAADIGRAVGQMPLVQDLLPVETNIVIFDIASEGPTAGEVVGRLREVGLLLGALDERRIRVVTHLDVDAADGERLCAALKAQLS